MAKKKEEKKSLAEMSLAEKTANSAESCSRVNICKRWAWGELEVSCGSALNLDELHYGIFKCLKRRQVDFLVSKEASLLIQEYSAGGEQMSHPPGI